MEGKILLHELVFLRQRPANRDELLRFLAEKVAAHRGLGDEVAGSLYQGLIAREAKGSTGVGGGIAIPHCSSARLKDFVVLAATVPEGVAYGSFDKAPCKLFFCIVGPEGDRNQHVRLLSSLTVGLAKPRALDQLLSCDSAEAFVQLMLQLMGRASGGEVTAARPTAKKSDKGGRPSVPLVRVELFCQREQSFRKLVEEFAADSICAPVVLEANNVGSYLHTVPLFASLWGDEKPNRFMRVIIAVLTEKNYAKLERSVRQLAKKSGTERGLLLLKQSLDVCYGSLDY